MLRHVLNRLADHLGHNEKTDEKETDEIQFRPSRLDASVRYAHGAGDNAIEHEIATIREEAKRLEEQRGDANEGRR
jgi:hypothetical protein